MARQRYPELPPGHPALAIYTTWLGDALTRGVYLGWLDERDERVVAGVGLTLLEWGPTKGDPSPLRARLVNVYTDPEYRRRGVAQALLSHAIAEAESLGIRTLSLGTTDMARGLYEKLGFRSYASEMIKRG